MGLAGLGAADELQCRAEKLLCCLPFESGCAIWLERRKVIPCLDGYITGENTLLRE